MLAGAVSPSAHRTRSPVTGAAAQVFCSRCEAIAASAAYPRLSGSGVFVRIVAEEPPTHDFFVKPFSARAGKVRPAGRAGSTIRGGQLLSSDCAGRLTRRLRRRCCHRESPTLLHRVTLIPRDPCHPHQMNQKISTFHSGRTFSAAQRERSLEPFSAQLSST